jgi:hypothetical protein
MRSDSIEEGREKALRGVVGESIAVIYLLRRRTRVVSLETDKTCLSKA